MIKSELSEKYLNLLVTKYAGLNLTRILDKDEFYWKQIEDSLIPLENSEVFKKSIYRTGLCIDVGFGGGFPLIPMANNFADIKMVGLEARNKKALAVQDIAYELGLENVKTHHCRLEDLEIDRPAIFTLKAVGKIDEFLGKINPYVDDIEVFFFKGPNYDELENVQNVLNRWEIIEDKTFEIKHTEGRRFVGFRLKNNVPRGTKSKKNLVKLSELI